MSPDPLMPAEKTYPSAAVLASKEQPRPNRYGRLNRLLTGKEIFDRIGYGFTAHQFITILFFLTGAGPLLVGIIFGLRSAISSVISYVARSYTQVHEVSASTIAMMSAIFAFSLLGLILGVRVHSPAIFALAVLVGSVGVVTYGELFGSVMRRTIRHEKKNSFLRRITHYGLGITAISFLAAGWVFEHITGEMIVAFLSIPLTGYFLSFEIGAFCFFLSGYAIRVMPIKRLTTTVMNRKEFLATLWHQLQANVRLFTQDRYLVLLTIGAMLIATVEVLGATYYGYIVYDLFVDVYLGGFLNVALIFAIAIFASFLGPLFTRFLHRHTGLAPMFVFGSLLLVILPLTLLVNRHFFAVAAAVSCGVIGSSILGVAQSLLARKLLRPSHRKAFFQTIEALLVLPFLILVPLGALITHLWTFTGLYYMITIVLLGITLPLYFGLVLVSNRKQL